jgi:hypothetical protein
MTAKLLYGRLLFQISGFLAARKLEISLTLAGDGLSPRAPQGFKSVFGADFLNFLLRRIKPGQSESFLHDLPEFNEVRRLEIPGLSVGVGGPDFCANRRVAGRP